MRHIRHLLEPQVRGSEPHNDNLGELATLNETIEYTRTRRVLPFSLPWKRKQQITIHCCKIFGGSKCTKEYGNFYFTKVLSLSSWVIGQTGKFHQSVERAIIKTASLDELLMCLIWFSVNCKQLLLDDNLCRQIIDLTLFQIFSLPTCSIEVKVLWWNYP